jgi:hypothetical protein
MGMCVLVFVVVVQWPTNADEIVTTRKSNPRFGFSRHCGGFLIGIRSAFDATPKCLLYSRKWAHSNFGNKDSALGLSERLVAVRHDFGAHIFQAP